MCVCVCVCEEANVVSEMPLLIGYLAEIGSLGGDRRHVGVSPFKRVRHGLRVSEDRKRRKLRPSAAPTPSTDMDRLQVLRFSPDLRSPGDLHVFCGDVRHPVSPSSSFLCLIRGRLLFDVGILCFKLVALVWLRKLSICWLICFIFSV